jgi:nitroreductase
MEKQANTDHPIHTLLTNRWSPRAFGNRKVEKEKLQRLFEAARWAPSASNEQPWYFIIGQAGDDTYRKIFETLVEFNQLWAKTAPVLMLLAGKTKSGKSGKHNPWWQYDTGQAAAHLTFQAASDGLWLHQMGGFDAEKAGKSFNLPEDHTAITVIALGYQGDAARLHPNLQKLEIAERERKNTRTFVFSNTFGEPSKLI